MKPILKNQSGAVLTTFAVLLIALLGFAALATEVGRWYLVRSELSKAADAAAMAGAKNISNPNVAAETIAKEIGDENFPAGQLGTPGSGEEGSISFTPKKLGNNKVQVDGSVSAIAILARLFGVTQVATSSSGVAQRKEVEIMMVLDKSASMAGTPINNLKTAAKSFLSFFTETQDKDKMGLITFNTAVSVDHSLGTYFVNDMTTQINAITTPSDKRRATNSEDAIDRSDDQPAGGFTDQTGVPGDQRVQQFLIFFTDGNPTAFTDKFTNPTYNGGNPFDAVAYTGPNYTQSICDSPPDQYLSRPDTGYSIGVKALPTGDGVSTGIKWQVFGEYPVVGYDPNSNIPESKLLGGVGGWFYNVVRQKAIKHAQALKDKQIKIYTIGLGTQIDHAFLGKVASGSEFEYYTPDSNQLEAIFNTIAKDIRLRLVQ